MNHFSEKLWADFVRGVGPSHIKSEIEAHLASRCQECFTAAGMWRKVHAIAENEPGFAPPDDAVRLVKMEFAARQTQPETGAWAMARLMFDSLSQPLTAGVRSGASDSRQLVFDAEGTMVDLVLEMGQGSQTMSLVGQVVDKGGTRVEARRVMVTLWAENGQAVAEASGNEFGEFQIEFAPPQRLRLSIEIAGHKRIRIPPMNLHPAVTGNAVTDESRRHY